MRRERTPATRVTVISIHAPTWGATQRLIISVQILSYFNPRTHVGCDSDLYTSCTPSPQFQSTHPRGVRLCGASERAHPQQFQSTHPRGVRHNPRLGLAAGVDISIHAPTWGATRAAQKEGQADGISIHAPTWGATVKPSNGWLLGHKDNEFANENIIIINSVNIT